MFATGKSLSITESSSLTGVAAVIAREPVTPLTVSEEALRIATRVRLGLNSEERSIGLTSIDGADGRSGVARDLAEALAQMGPDPVVLVGQGHEPGKRGLGEVLRGDSTLTAALETSASSTLRLLPFGSLGSNIAALYTSPACRAVFEELTVRFRYVVLDSGSFRHPESMLLLSLCDTVAVALAAGRHRRAEVASLEREVSRLKRRVLGILLTGRKK